MAATSNLSETILETALKLAEADTWESVRLHTIAENLHISLADIYPYYAEKEALTNAWFARADRAMLQCAKQATFATLSAREKLHQLIMTWLNTLAKHKKVTEEIFLGKLEPGHLHVQIPALLRISRTVQWIREAAAQDATFVRRAIEESVLTTVFVATVIAWCCDTSPGQIKTANFLKKALGGLDRLKKLCP